MAAKSANYNLRYNLEVYVRVMCPRCGASGAHSLSMPQPLCHVCDCEVKMLPASNDKVECTWEEAVEYGERLKSIRLKK